MPPSSEPSNRPSFRIRFSPAIFLRPWRLLSPVCCNKPLPGSPSAESIHCFFASFALISHYTTGLGHLFFVYTFLSSFSCTEFASWFLFFSFLSVYFDTRRVGLQFAFVDLLQYPLQSFLFGISRLSLCRQIIWRSQQHSLKSSDVPAPSCSKCGNRGRTPGSKHEPASSVLIISLRHYTYFARF